MEGYVQRNTRLRLRRFHLEQDLKVGSCSFECIVFLFIYFLNRQKALFTRKKVSVSKKYRYKNIRLAVFLGIP